MSVWSRVANVFRSNRLDQDLDEELQSHLDEAQASGRDSGEASRAFGSWLRAREAARDRLVAPWLESLIGDVVFGWRQLLKHKAASLAAILSLALGLGSSLAAFRLIDGLFLRPLPVAHPERLYVLTYPVLFEGEIVTSDQFDYAAVLPLGDAVKDQAELLAINLASRVDLSFSSNPEIEHAWRQYVPGRMFSAVGLQPALGRLFTESDDRVPGAAPYAVISYDYWSRRFAKDPNVIGRVLRFGAVAGKGHSDVVGDGLFEIVGVAPEKFTGTDPGTFTDIFLPNMMNAAALLGAYRASNSHRMWLITKPGANIEQLQERLSAALHAWRQEQVKSWPAYRLKQEKDFFATAPIVIEPAGAGRSRTQHEYQRALTIFAVLVLFVLLIACANVSNLMAAQAAARAREMALRVSIGAGRARLVQLVLVESALIATAASLLGLAFSWWAASFLVAKLNPPNVPMRLLLATDARVLLFALALTFAITIFFGLAPALRASSIQPASMLKGGLGESGTHPRARRRLINGLVAAQVAFCSFVLFVAGQFIATFERMANQPTGFSTTRLLAVESLSAANQSATLWYQATQQLKSLPGVESVALAQYALMSNNALTRPIWANGHSPDGTWTNSTWFLGVSPGWFETMGLNLLAGRDFREDDQYPDVAVVNEKFARRYFGDQSPVGRTFETLGGRGDAHLTVRIIGVTRDARYEDMRLPIPATAYTPFRTLDGSTARTYKWATFLVRAKASDSLSLVSTLRRELPVLRPEFSVGNIVTQKELVEWQMVRERLLAALSLFFAAVALVLAAVGLYGVLNYAVLERRRELGICLALGAKSGDVVRRVTIGTVAMVIAGSVMGLGIGLASEHYIASLLYQVKASDPGVLAVPLASLFGAALLAALPPSLRAARIDPAELLRSE